jgi:hypothetical protein
MRLRRARDTHAAAWASPLGNSSQAAVNSAVVRLAVGTAHGAIADRIRFGGSFRENAARVSTSTRAT